ncbi:MAG TPA: hypothetical protein PLJ97_01745 [Candidatus Saccharibacteria bacterium]|jgi:hypothetical protein|nr:hypothetical protein [Candidatus Saccharibacteria bacterium]
MHKLLSLQKNQHTAKKMSHCFTSYRALWLVMTFFGVLLILVQRSTIADSFVVTAKIPAPMPSKPPVITVVNNKTAPPHGELKIVETPNVVISGNCPVIVPSIMVGIFRDNQLISSGGCSTNGEFNVATNLVRGENVLIPKIITITGDIGPAGDPLKLTLVLGISTASTTNTSSGEVRSANINSFATTKFAVFSDSPFITYGLNKQLTWQLTIAGGVAPYKVSVNWGDGQKSTYFYKTNGVKKLHYTYGLSKTYLVKLTATDKQGEVVSFSVAAVTLENNSHSPGVFGVVGERDEEYFLIDWQHLVTIYIVILVAILAFWLGSKKEKMAYAKSRNSRKKSKR